MGVLFYPLLLNGKAKADEKNIGGGASDVRKHSLILRSLSGPVKISVMCSANIEARQRKAQTLCRLLRNTLLAAEKIDGKSLFLGVAHKLVGGINSRKAVTWGITAQATGKGEPRAVGNEQRSALQE